MTDAESAALVAAANGLRDVAAAERQLSLYTERAANMGFVRKLAELPKLADPYMEGLLESQRALVAGLVCTAAALEECARCGSAP